MLKRAFLIALMTAVFAGASLPAREADADPCADGRCEGAFDVGPYRMVFFATQTHEEGTAQRYYREIPSFGPTRLNLEIAGYGEDKARPPLFDDLKDLDIEAQLFWGKNELKAPELLKTHQAHGVGALSFDYDFAEDGKYLIAVNIRKADGAAYKGGRLFFVIQSADSDLAIAALASVFILGFAFVIWRRRQRPLTPRAPPL